MSETTNKARTLLAAATPRPWRFGNATHDWVVADAPTGHDDETTVRAYGGHLVCESTGAPRCPAGNASLIVAAPDMIAALCDEGEAMEAERDALEYSLTAAERRVEEAEAQAAAMRLALEKHVVCPTCSGSGCRDMECRVVNGQPEHTCDETGRCWTCRGAGRHAEMQSAISGDAGRALLDRLRIAEAERDELRAERDRAVRYEKNSAVLWSTRVDQLRADNARLGAEVTALQAKQRQEGGAK